MDLLTWPNVTLEQFQDLVPELKHLEPSLKERVMIEGKIYSYAAPQRALLTNPFVHQVDTSLF